MKDILCCAPIVAAIDSPVELSIGGYIPLLVICAVLGITFILFRIFNVSIRILWRLLINGLIGAGLLCVFDIVLAIFLGMDFFYIPITWLSSLVSGLLGVPGVLLLLLLKFMI